MFQMKTFSTQTEENVVLEDKSVQYNRDELESDKIMQAFENLYSKLETIEENSFQKYPCVYCD